MRHRACELAPCPPFKIISGRAYGVCPLVSECPDNIVCGYAMTRQNLRDERERDSTAFRGEQ
jgi:hypothetical protein